MLRKWKGMMREVQRQAQSESTASTQKGEITDCPGDPNVEDVAAVAQEQGLKNDEGESEIIVSRDVNAHMALTSASDHGIKSDSINTGCLDGIESIARQEAGEVFPGQECQERSREFSSDLNAATAKDGNLQFAKRQESEITDPSRDLPLATRGVEAKSGLNSDAKIVDEVQDRQIKSRQLFTAPEEQVLALRRQEIELTAESEQMTIRHIQDNKKFAAAADKRQGIILDEIASCEISESDTESDNSLTSEAYHELQNLGVALLIPYVDHELQTLERALSERDEQLAPSPYDDDDETLHWQYEEAIAALTSRMLERHNREKWNFRLDGELLSLGILENHQLELLRRNIDKRPRR